MIYFVGPLKYFIGKEPPGLVREGLYGLSRNPMYLAVIAAAAGQSIVFASWKVGLYAGALFLFFHLVVVLLEEPHLRKERGQSYEEYCRRVPRWLGLPRQASLPRSSIM